MSEFKDVKLSTIIEKINVYNVPIKYDEMNVVKEKIIKGGHIVFFEVGDPKTLRKYEHSLKKDEFKSTTYSIHLPDLTLSEFIDCLQCDALNGTQYGAYNSALGAVKSIVEENNYSIPDSYLVLFFCFLHEVGHMKQFIRYNQYIKAYSEWCAADHKVIFEQQQSVYRKMNDRKQKGNSCPITFKEKKELLELAQKYRNLPNEKDADEFAISEIMTAVKIFLGEL